MSEIYAFFCASTLSCLYVGQAFNAQARYQTHVAKLRAGTHRQAAWSSWFSEHQFNETSMICVILENVEDTDEARNCAEIAWFNELSPKFFGKIPSTAERWAQSESSRKSIAAGVSAVRQAKSLSNVDRICEACGSAYRAPLKSVTRCKRVKCKRERRQVGQLYAISVNDLTDMYRTMSLRQIADILEVSHISIRNRMMDLGIALRSQGSKPTGI